MAIIDSTRNYFSCFFSNRIKILILIHLHLSFLFEPLLDAYKRSQSCCSSKFEKSTQSPIEIRKSFTIDTSAHQINETLSSEKVTLHWTEHNIISKFFKLYRFVTTGYFIYVLIKCLLPINSFVAWFGLEKPGHCYFVGRIIITSSFRTSRITAVVLTIANLFWRSIRTFRKPKLIGTFLFVLEESDEIFDCNNRDFNIKDKFFEDENEFAMLSILCYPEVSQTRNSYCLRLNRTPAAHQKMRQFWTSAVKLCTVVMFILWLPASLMLNSIILFDQGYLSGYPGCSPELQRLHDESKLDEWAITLTNHRILALFADALENFIVWTDSVLAATFIGSIVFIINHDIEIYCQHLFEEIELILVRTRMIEQSNLCEQSCSSETITITLNQPDNLEPNFKLSQSRKQKKIAIELERSTHEIQIKFTDFLKQIRVADFIISDIITMAGTLLLVSLAAMTFYLVEFKVDSVLLRFTEFAGLVIFCVLGLTLVRLERSVIKMYKLLSSMMAFDQSRYKQNFKKLLELYEVAKMPYYTLFHFYPFTGQTFITILGWTVSVGLIVENFLAYRGRVT